MFQPRGRTFAELDLLFERKVSARKFASTEVDVFDETLSDGSSLTEKVESRNEHTEKQL